MASRTCHLDLTHLLAVSITMTPLMSFLPVFKKQDSLLVLTDQLICSQELAEEHLLLNAKEISYTLVSEKEPPLTSHLKNLFSQLILRQTLLPNMALTLLQAIKLWIQSPSYCQSQITSPRSLLKTSLHTLLLNASQRNSSLTISFGDQGLSRISSVSSHY